MKKSKSLVELAERLRQSGQSYQSIGQSIGVSKDTVRLWLKPDEADKHREYQSKWRADNSAYVRKRNRSYYKNNKLRCREYQKIYRELNPTALKHVQKRYRDRNRHETISYFIVDVANDAVKIGSSNSINLRLRSLQNGNVTKLQLLGVCNIPECNIHLQFSSERMSGEWFQITPGIQTFIDTHCREKP